MFQNFLRNSMRVRDSSLITQSWELISAEMNAQVSVWGTARTLIMKI